MDGERRKGVSEASSGEYGVPSAKYEVRSTEYGVSIYRLPNPESLNPPTSLNP